MKLEKLVGDRFRERPADCALDSHALMLRGGYMKAVTAGIYSQYLPLRRICRKIEEIIRQEMDAIDGQEVQFPVALPASLWEESGRYQSVGDELLRFSDRNDAPMVLGMTHEEAAVQLVREYGKSYSRYPFMIYQIQTKFRDEARPRGGLIRVREFTMKDAYSFHTSQQDLEQYYSRCYRAYERIFARVGLPQVVAVASDSGMMGGNLSHEYMLLTPVGEDSIAICGSCGFRANVEAAETIVSHAAGEERPLTPVQTPGVGTIDELCAFFGTTPDKTCKAVALEKADGGLLVVFLRGDLELSEAKLTALLGQEVRPAALGSESGLTAGFIGPLRLPEDCTVLFDRSLEGETDLICGGGEEDLHCTGLSMRRDVHPDRYHDLAKARDGCLCPCCGRPSIRISRGIEVGNIFQLGDKYTRSMGMQYLDGDGKLQYPVMGCYGIGIGRLAASICEASRDEYGPIWPVTVAPWQVHLCCVRADDPETHRAADALYHTLQQAGIEVIYDDRDVRAGVMFSDADLLGVPVRAVISPRNLQQGVCELSARDRSFSEKVPLAGAAERISQLLERLKAEVNRQAPER